MPHAPIIDGWIDRVAARLEQAVGGGAVWLEPDAVMVSGALPPVILQRVAARIDALHAPGHHGYLAPAPAALVRFRGRAGTACSRRAHS